MGEEKNTFIVYADDIKEIIDELNDNQVASLFRAMVDYQVSGKEPGFSGSLRFVWIPIRQHMDRDCAKWQRTKERRSAAGRKGGIRSGEVRNKTNEANEANEAMLRSGSNASTNEANEANISGEAVNVNVNDNVNVNVNGNVNVPHSFKAVSGDDPLSLSSSLVSYLNKKTGGNYRATKSVTERIGDLVADGYTAEDMVRVIDLKVSEWGGSEKMRQYLRPSTLFGEKFEEYVQQPDPPEVEESRRAEKELAALDEKRLIAKEVLGRLEKEVKGIEARGVRDHWDEWQVAADKRDAARAQLESVEKRIKKLRGD